jgi:hypothetical protein
MRELCTGSHQIPVKAVSLFLIRSSHAESNFQVIIRAKGIIIVPLCSFICRQQA